MRFLDKSVLTISVLFWTSRYYFWYFLNNSVLLSVLSLNKLVQFRYILWTSRYYFRLNSLLIDLLLGHLSTFLNQNCNGFKCMFISLISVLKLIIGVISYDVIFFVSRTVLMKTRSPKQLSAVEKINKNHEKLAWNFKKYIYTDV